MRALIVEPSRFVANLLSALFQKHGVEPVVVVSGGEALAELGRAKVDLLCLSYELGDMKGVDLVVAARSRELLSSQPVLLFAATHDKKLVDRALRAGVTECFSKHQMADLDRFVGYFAAGSALKIGGHVLLVEDSATSALFCIKVLIKLGLTVDQCKSAEEAAQKFATHVYDLVLTDYVLAGTGTGLAVIRAVRDSGGRKATTPILAMSALQDTPRRIEILRNGANDFVGKPVVAEELKMRVYNLITMQRLVKRLESQHLAMEEMAMHDQLTSFYNRHYLQAKLPLLMEKTRRQGRPFSIVVVDIDHFKRVNDTHGHAAGDMVLVEVAEAMQGVAGKDDLLARIGGEEFLAVALDVPHEAALSKAETLRRRIEELAPGGIPVTASFGVATLAAGESYEQLFKRADDAVYRAKEGGRNRVEDAG